MSAYPQKRTSVDSDGRLHSAVNKHRGWYVVLPDFSVEKAESAPSALFRERKNAEARRDFVIGPPLVTANVEYSHIQSPVGDGTLNY